MKTNKFLTVLIVLVLALSMTGIAFAEDEPPAEETPVVEEVVVLEPVVEEPVTEEPPAEEPIVEETPAVEFAAAEEPPMLAMMAKPENGGGGGNVTCSELGYDFGSARVNYTNGVFDGPFPEGIWVGVTDGTYVSWTSTFPIGAVIVKGSNDANVYEYIPPSYGADGLHSPENASGNPAGLSNLTFCWNLPLTVAKTAISTFDRNWTWNIDKVGDQTALTLMPGQSYLVNYDVTVNATSADSNWAVSGEITINNPNPTATATIESVSDVVSPDIDATVVCGVAFPYTLAAGETLTCSYSTALPDGAARTNTATATTSGKVAGGSGSASVAFGAPTNEYDECIYVTDDKYGALGTVCADDAPVTFTYNMFVGPYDTCGDYTFVNIASFVTNDTGATGSDDHTVDVTVPCGGGCTLTQGYWKTHSEFGPAPYDNTWALLPNGASTNFFLSSKSWYQVFWTPPAGNAYYNLAHQYMAAKLNILNGASTTSQVDLAIAKAEAFFTIKSPGAKLTNIERNNILKWAGILDQYNNGYIGPGHCNE